LQRLMVFRAAASANRSAFFTPSNCRRVAAFEKSGQQWDGVYDGLLYLILATIWLRFLSITGKSLEWAVVPMVLDGVKRI
jgi:hypothetical protein